MLSLPPGAAAIYEESANLKQFRDDVACYPVPFDKLTAAVCPEAKLRKLVKNMIYVGVAAQLLDMDMADRREDSLRKQFAKKQKAADLNWAAVEGRLRLRGGRPSPRHDPFVLERMHATEGKIIIDGNAACALGAIFAGCTVVMWYPITPSIVGGRSNFIDYAQAATASRPTARPPSPSCRQKTSWLQSAWCWAQAGPAHAQ